MNRAVLLLCAVLAGCAASGDTEASPSEYALSLSTSDGAIVLEVVNYPGTDLGVLDDDVHLDARAARNIIAHRNGADGVCPSSDDQLFTDLAQLDALPYVGDTAFRALRDYAAAHPAPAAETVEGVGFRGWESQAIVFGVANASVSDLDQLLDGRAARALIDHRPYSSVAQMGPVAYVGPSALQQLRAAAPMWWTAMRSGAPSLAGTFDGVAFDEATAHVALEIANGATAAELGAHGIGSSAASAITAGRVYSTLARVAARSGVGPATMTALKAYAQSGQWGAPPPMCNNTFADAVTPYLDDVLFLSESDRPIEVVTFPGAGASAPTAASVLALVGGATAELRGTENYFVALEPSSDMADASAPAAIEAAVSASLTDVIYVAVHLPRSDPYHAEVRVYLVGRTACGDLVGLRSIAVET